MFHNRTDAGNKRAEALSGLKNARPVVITIPMGGLPVGAAISAALDAPLDIALAKKIGHPQTTLWRWANIMKNSPRSPTKRH